MSGATDLTPEAMEGWNAGLDGADRRQAPYLATSPSWYAWQAGYYCAQRVMDKPTDVRMGRGSKVRVRDLVFDVQLSMTGGVRIEMAA